MAYLYRHIRLDTNQVFYVGIGEVDSPPYTRAYSSKSRNQYWKNITNKTLYKVDIILDNLSWEEACQKEIEFIKLYGRKDLNEGTLVNLTDGGDGLFNPSNKVRNKKSLSMKGTFQNNPNLSRDIIEKRNLTYKSHPELLQNLSNKRIQTFINNPQIQINRVKKIDWISMGSKIANNLERGNKISQSLKKPIAQKDLSNNLIQIYPSLKEAADLNSFNAGGICNALKGISKTAYGFRWEYL